MDFNFDTGAISIVQTLDPTTLPPLGGTVNVLTIAGTGALQLTSGTTAERPTGVNGMIRYNTDLNILEGFVAGSWVATSQIPNGTGNQFLTMNGAGTAQEYKTLAGTAGNITVAFGVGTATINLASVVQGAGSNFVKVTLDGFGRVTGNTAVGASDITTALGYTPINKAGDTGIGSLSFASAANITLSGGGEVLGLPTTPSVADAAASKAYVDSMVAGLSWKTTVRAATLVPGTLATSFENGDTIDGVVLATGNRILIKNQSTQSENGIYVVNATGAPTRASDADTGTELVNAAVFVDEGSQADTAWVQTTNAPITIGVSNIVFVQFAGTGTNVTSFSAGTTGFTPSSPTSGAVTLAGTLNVANGGTGLTTTPTAGQLLIGNGTGYTLATLTQGTGITVTNGPGGAITITNAGVTSIAGTTNQITASASTGAVTLSIPATFIAPGSIASTTTITAGSNFIASTASSSYTSTTGTAIQVIPGAAANATANGNTLTLQGGPGGGTSGAGGNAVLTAGTPTAGAGGSVNVTATAGVGTNQNGGTLTLTAGDRTGTGTAGSINLVIPATGTLQINGVSGTAGQALVSNGPGAAPTWQSVVASGVALSGITAAIAANTINNADFAQTWNWALTTAAKSAFTFSENVASTNGVGNQWLMDIGTIAASTAGPLRVRAQGNNVLTITNTGSPTLQGADTTTAQNIVLRGGNTTAATVAGGSATLQGGTGNTTGAGGQVNVTGGQGGATGSGAAVVIAGGAGGATSGAAGGVTITGGTPVSGAGGTIAISSSNGVGTNQNAGNITLTGGNPTGTGTPGAITLTAGALQGAGTPAAVTLNGGAGNGATTGGAVNLNGGSGGTSAAGANVVLTGGPGGLSSGNGGAVNLVGGTPTSGTGGAVNITAAAGAGSNQAGGIVTITSGAATGTGTPGEIRNITTDGNWAYANGNFSAFGDAVTRTRILRNTTTNNTTTELFLDGTSSRIVLPNNSAYTFDILVVARRTDATGGRAGYRFVGVISKDGTAGSTTFTGTPSKTLIGETDGVWDAAVVADTTNGALVVRVNGQNAKTIRWVATVRTTEVTN